MAVGNKKKIFISYRVNDTQAATGRLADGLKQYFDDDQIFMDIEKIEPGLDFTEVIPKYLNASDIVLAVIGPQWSGYNAETGRSRIMDSHDWVRREIASALEQNIRVIPVLLEGGTIPAEDQLPEDLKLLARRQAFEITNKRWKYDSEQLTAFLKKTLNEPFVFRNNDRNRGGNNGPNDNRPPVPEPKKQSKSNVGWIIAAAIIGLLVLIKLAASVNETEPNNFLDDPNNNTDYSNIQQKTDPEPERPPVQVAIKNIAGTWYDPNGKGTFMITQNGENLSMQVYGVGGEQTGSGTGYIKGREVTLQATIYYNGSAIPSEIIASLSDDERTLSGTLKIANNGAAYTEGIMMQKQ